MQVTWRLGRSCKVKIGSYIFIFFISSVKFLFAPVTAVHLMSYWETIIVTTLGGWAGCLFFYFGASYFFKRAEAKRKKKEMAMRAAGNYVAPRKFTRTNKLVVRIKRGFGLLGLCVVTPAMISIPFGCIILARFYPNWRVTIPILFAFVLAFSFLLTTFGDMIFRSLGWIE